MGVSTAGLRHAVKLEFEQAGKRVGQCLNLLGAEMISWLHVQDPCEPLRAGRDELARLVEAIPDLEAAELTIAADILLSHAPNEIVADWLIACMRAAETLIDDVGHGLRLREMLEIAEEDSLTPPTEELNAMPKEPETANLRTLLTKMFESGTPIFTPDNPLGRLLAADLALKPIFIADKTTITKVDIVVGALCDDDHPLLLLDNEIGDCSACGRRIQFRPDCPRGGAFHCVECALKRINL